MLLLLEVSGCTILQPQFSNCSYSSQGSSIEQKISNLSKKSSVSVLALFDAAYTSQGETHQLNESTIKDVKFLAHRDIIYGVGNGILSSLLIFANIPNQLTSFKRQQQDLEQMLANALNKTEYDNGEAIRMFLTQPDPQTGLNLIDKIEKNSRNQMTLMTGVVDLSTGASLNIDLSVLALRLKGKQRESCIVGTLLAATRQPIIKYPVLIDDTPYADGLTGTSALIPIIQTLWINLGTAKTSRNINVIDISHSINGQLLSTDDQALIGMRKTILQSTIKELNEIASFR